MIDVDYPNLLSLFPEHIAPKRSESASFLIWYLENYYRLDSLEAVDHVCDQSGDKGVDGIFVNDNDQTITIFQSRILQSSKSSIGDKGLREFAGTLSQFKDAASIKQLIDTAKDAEVASLAKRLDLINKIATHELRGEFVSNIELDHNGIAFLKTAQQITFVGKERLVTTYISDERDLQIHGPVSLDIAGFPVSEYIVDANIRAIIAPIKASELVELHGISDQSLFAYNVRGPLGKTNVNKDIVTTVKDASSHKMFPLFHNGMTIIAAQVEVRDGILTASDYFVVNGCQSLTSLYNNQNYLTDNLRVLVKFIRMDPRSDWAAKITQFSNNQNGVKARDFKANNPIQIRLQNEFAQNYTDEYVFEIKRGEANGNGRVISNEDAGLFLMAFDMKEPWGTHRKYEVFEDKYPEIFGKPEVVADRIVLCQVILEGITAALPDIKNVAFSKYVLTKYMLMYFFREIIETDPLGQKVLTEPQLFVRNKNDRNHFRQCVDRIIKDVIIDLNLEVKNLGDNFDYRDKLRDSGTVKGWASTILKDRLKMINRGSIPSFKADWENKTKSGW